jgi:3-phenylpropionate/trans-cinnamate dioxygenase ferredoxin subunit
MTAHQTTERYDAMKEYIAVAQIGEVPPGGMKWIALDGQRVVLANVDGTVYALKDMCGHQRAPLSRGRLEDYVVECPKHFARFDVRNGKYLGGPPSADVPVFDVRVVGEIVFVRAPEGDTDER